MVASAKQLQSMNIFEVNMNEYEYFCMNIFEVFTLNIFEDHQSIMNYQLPVVIGNSLNFHSLTY